MRDTGQFVTLFYLEISPDEKALRWVRAGHDPALLYDPDIDKFKDSEYKMGQTGTPIVLDNAIGYMDLELIDHFSVRTHTIFVGKIVESKMIDDAEPLIYSYYRDIKGGRSAKNAPTYDGWKEEQ